MCQFVVTSLFACSVWEDDAAGDKPPPSKDRATVLREIQATAYERAERAADGAVTNDPDYDGSTGDALLFDGLLCSVGVAESCTAVQNSQGASGQFWRSPQWVDRDYGSGSTFSRDMALGALAALSKTGDKVRAEQWGTYIRANDYRLCENESNCKLQSPAIWSVFGQTFKKIDAARFGAMRLLMGGHETLAPLVPATPRGYRSHLIAVEVWILRLAGIGKPNTSRLLFEKEPLNPFFAYLAGDHEAAYNLTLRWCSAPDGTRQAWLWERELPRERPELGSGGWDCVFMTQLLLGG
jgi:hypothetical protein